MSCVVHWFRNDLRVSDNPALTAAAAEARKRGLPLLPVFFWDDAQTELQPPTGATPGWVSPRMGPHRQAWLAGNLRALEAELQARGSWLLVLRGEPGARLPQLIRSLGAVSVHAEDIPAPQERDEVARIRRATQDQGVQLTLHWQATMLPLEALPFAPGPARRPLPDIFTAFRQQVEHAACRPRTPLPAPDTLPAMPELPGLTAADVLDVDALRAAAAATTDDRSSFPFHQPAFAPGERGASAHLARYFARRLPHSYKATRNGLSGTDFSSKLSPWLAVGALSAAQAIAAIRGFEAEHGANDGSYWLWFELLWREHFRLLHCTHGKALYRARGLSRLPAPPHNQAAFQRWCEGRTGEPLVDAGMRELAATGWLSNRLRQMVASFLVHDLACDWRAGATWFESRLIDFDVHSNQGNWLYVAGRGTDPRGGRRFNADKQAREHDPDGSYRRLWGTA